MQSSCHVYVLGDAVMYQSCDRRVEAEVDAYRLGSDGVNA